MNNKKLFSMLFFLTLFYTFAWTQMGNFEFKEAHILSFSQDKIQLEIEIIKKESPQIIFIQAKSTTLEDKKGKPVLLEDLWVGTKIRVSGYIENDNRLIADRLVLLTNTDDWKDTADGLLEEVNDNQAIIDGRVVKLMPKTVIKGKKDLNGMEYSSFSAIELGAYITVTGRRDKEGVIHGTKGSVYSNNASDLDKQVRSIVAGNFSTEKVNQAKPSSQTIQDLEALGLPINHLNDGHINMGGLQLKLVQDYRVQAYVNKVGRKLIPAHMKALPDNHENKVHFRFFVVDNPVFNAFAFPDGTIFVNTGLLAVIENEAQLAAVLGHEIAHCVHEHGAKRVHAGKLAQVGLGATLLTLETAGQTKFDVPTRNVIGTLLQLGTAGFLADFGRQHEEQSDRVGLYYMQKAGYDPREAPAVWKQLMDMTADKKVMEKITQNLADIFTAAENFNGKNPFSNLNTPVVNTLVEKLLTPLYSSHPKLKKRYSSLNKLISYNYQGVDFEKLNKGDEKYQKFVHQVYQNLVTIP